MVGDYISTSYGSDNLAHGVFMTAGTPTSGTTCGSVANNCNETAETPSSGLAASGTVSSAGDPVVYTAKVGNPKKLWDLNFRDNIG